MKKRLFKIIAMLMLSILFIGSTTTTASASDTHTQYQQVVTGKNDHGLFSVIYGSKITYDIHGIKNVEPILYSVGASPKIELITQVINSQSTHEVSVTIYYKIDALNGTAGSGSISFKSPFSHSGGGRDF